jgi:hypothetical protein
MVVLPLPEVDSRSSSPLPDPTDRSTPGHIMNCTEIIKSHVYVIYPRDHSIIDQSCSAELRTI